MKKQLIKWLVASLIMPVLLLLFKQKLNFIFVLLFWPSSIVLMSLGANERPLSDIIYVWSVAVGLNIISYLLIGFGYYKLKKYLAKGNYKM